MAQAGWGVAYHCKEQFRSRALYRRYLTDTIRGLELTRGKNWLLNDATWVRDADGSRTLKTVNRKTSPTNMALDILVQLGLGTPISQGNVKRILKTIASLEVDGDSNL